VAFQRTLTGLQELRIKACLPDNDCLLVAIAGLTNLESLSLIRPEHVFTDATLPLLSPLTKLTHLCLYHAKAGMDEEDEKDAAGLLSAEAEVEFLAGMPFLNYIYWL
jgi:hypothetical protein